MMEAENQTIRMIDILLGHVPPKYSKEYKEEHIATNLSSMYALSV